MRRGAGSTADAGGAKFSPHDTALEEPNQAPAHLHACMDAHACICTWHGPTSPKPPGRALPAYVSVPRI